MREYFAGVANGTAFALTNCRKLGHGEWPARMRAKFAMYHCLVLLHVIRYYPTLLLSISSPNIDQKFFHWHTPWKTCNKVILNYPTTLELHHYTTLWNINISKTNNSCSQFVRMATFRTFQKVQTKITLDCVRPVSLDIWHVEWCVCDWSSWLSTSLSTVVSGHVLFSTCGLRSTTPMPTVGAFCFPNLFFNKLLNALLFHFISTNSVSSLREPHSLYWCKLFKKRPK